MLEVLGMLKVLMVSEMVKVPGMLRFLGFLGTPGQVNLLHGLALGRGRCAGWPQGGQQQRRLAQVRPAAILPVPAVLGPGGRAELGDEGGRISGPNPPTHPCRP
jgi:hypothetical protein